MYFEEFRMGQRFPGISVTVTETHVVLFGSITHDWAYLHMNEELARKSPFGKRIAHGPLTAALAVSGVVPIVGAEAATHLGDTFAYRDPVLIGDTVTTECEVTELTRKSKWGLLKLKLTTKNQHGKVVLDGEAVLGVHYRPKAAAPS